MDRHQPSHTPRRGTGQRRGGQVQLTAAATGVFVGCLALSGGLSAGLLRWHAAVVRAERANVTAAMLEQDGRRAAIREALIARALADERHARSQTDLAMQRLEAQRETEAAASAVVPLIARDQTAQALRALEQAVRGFRERSDLAAELSLLLSAGAALVQRGHPDEAEPLLAQALTRARAAGRAGDAATIEAHTSLASLHRARRQLDTAAEHLQQAIALRRATAGPRDHRLATAVRELARLQFERQRYADVEVLCEEALDLARGRGERSDAAAVAEPIVDDLCLLATAALCRGEAAKAAATCQRLLEADLPVDATALREARRSLRRLAHRFVDAGRYAEGTVLLERALASQAPSRVVHTASAAGDMLVHDPIEDDDWRLLARLYVRSRLYPKAQVIFARLIARREVAVGKDDPQLADDASELADLYERERRLSEAEALHKLAMEIRERALGPDHVDVAKSALRLADLYRLAGKTPEADALSEVAREIHRKSDAERP
jgi:tetratricopeptide (TPR) repeat protein